MNDGTIRTLCILALSLLLTACTSSQLHHSSIESCPYSKDGDCSDSAIQMGDHEEKGKYLLGIIEYDDSGKLHSIAQKNAVLKEFREVIAKEDVMLITFVHGWHNTAEPDNDNLSSFRNMLVQVSQMESIGAKQQSRKPRKVLGLYVGWRGEALEIPVINNLTFWNRKDTAHKVGEQGVSGLLIELEDIVDHKTGSDSRLVVIGHSFGGALVYSSLEQVLLERYKQTRQSKGNVDGFGNLVVLINPAFEAIRYSELYKLSQTDCRPYKNSQLPKLAIITSEGDWATKYAFPFGQLFSKSMVKELNQDSYYCTADGKSGEQPLKIDAKSAERTTVGHFKPYLTHRLAAVSDGKDHGAGFQIQDLQMAWGAQSIGGTLDLGESKLISLGRSTALNPYLNVEVDTSLIDDHNDIWSVETTHFIRDLIAVATTPQRFCGIPFDKL
ncbi:alpha/beta fold hydrolase [Dongshaea marina]|uniref:hypothetical protein n=1 Tax=Dongshaea marina TaxID=2047966 RepID=UPI0018FFEED0|nr:hypothetical protein [Dongshaea marina]